MATKFENYIAGDEGTLTLYGQYWQGQTFAPLYSHDISSVKVKVYRVGSPSTMTVSLRATSGGEPTGADLAVGTIDGDTFTTLTTGEWKEITFTTSYELKSGTTYALVARCAGASSSNSVRWRCDYTSPTYTRGSVVTSTNTGAAWTVDTIRDFMFEEWGDVLSSTAPSVTTQAVSSIAKTTATGNGNVTSLGTPTATQYGICWATHTNPTI